ncbi:uncharacterized protein [Apostichopus japonicus]|uniref:uncharacterized protein isoform X2 n=1 Tax=Stichopus japonicus TaxID=307972 RepID=UPI003AB59D5E
MQNVPDLMTEKILWNRKANQINNSNLHDSTQLFKMKVDAALSHHVMHSLLFLLVFNIVGSSSNTVVTYTTKNVEEMQCLINGNTLAATWTDSTTDDSLYTYKISSPDIDNERTEPKHDNFKYSYVPNTHFNLIIDKVEREDEGTYSCFELGDDNNETVYDVTVEAIPDEISFDCFVPPAVTCPAQGVNPTSELICTCAAKGVHPGTLSLDISGADNVQQDSPVANDGLFDLSLTATVPVTDSAIEVTCSVNGYSTTEPIPPNLITKTLMISPPTCALDISFDQDCKEATLSCSCFAIPTDGESPSDSGMVFSYFNGTGHLIQGNTTTTVQTNDVEAGVDLTYSCRGCNGLYYGDSSYVTDSKVCTITSTVTTQHRSTNDPRNKISDCNYTGLIAACIVEAIIIVMLVLVIIYLIARDRLGNGKQEEPRSKNQVDEKKGTENRAYMDLQELEVNTNEKNKNLEVPEKNVKLVSLLPGKGMMQYHKAIVMKAAGNLEAVVRTLSGDSTLRMNELQTSEVQHILKLPGDNSIMKLLGWCDTVPNYLICEYLSGGTLSDHLTEEFSPQKAHQYGNTKQKRFQVAEKGNADHLPKYALQVARGLKFLTTHRFISPGLRSKKVLLTASGKCKLYDFVSVDNAKEWTELSWNEDVPFQWMPPEFLFLETISAAGDVWSFGVLLWEIFSYGSEPYQGQNRADVEKSLRAKQQLLLPDNCPGAIWQVMITCWETAAEKRPKIDDVTLKLAAMCNEDKEYQEI